MTASAAARATVPRRSGIEIAPERRMNESKLARGPATGFTGDKVQV
jgi:hypothetical protein